jgi:hypothetical protein
LSRLAWVKVIAFIVSERRALEWLEAATADGKLLLAPRPALHERRCFWIVDVRSPAEFRRAVVRYLHLLRAGLVDSCAWFAGHSKTEQCGQIATERRNKKFLVRGEPDLSLLRSLRRQGQSAQ